MEGERHDQDSVKGIFGENLFSENIWRVLIITSAAAVLLFSIYCLTNGITIIFMHLYYFPIMLLAYRYRYRGFILATLLALAYIGLVYFYDIGQADIITGAWYRLIVFIGIAAVVAYLSDQLAAAHRSQKGGLDTIRKLQQFQQSVIANANIWITVLDSTGTILVWNDAAEAISGYVRGEVLGNNRVWKQLYPEKEYRQKVTSEIKRIIGRDTYLENFETEIHCADGTQKTIIWNTRGIRDTAGSGQSYIAIGRDITQQKRAESALQDSEARLKEVGEIAHVGGWELDVRTKGVHWTKETYRIHDISEDEKSDLSKAILFFDLPERSILEAALQRCIENGEPFDLELPFTSAKGRHLRTRAMGRAVSIDGVVVKMTGTFQDITERKRTEIALSESETRYRNLFESSRDAMMTLEPPSWRFTSSNPATVQMFMARDEAQFTSTDPWVLSPERQPDGRDSGEKANEMIETAIRDGTHFFEWTHKRLNGKDFPAIVLLSRVELAGKVFLQATIRDITEHKRTQDALKESEEKYREFFTTSRDCVFITSPGGQWIDFNDVALEMFGYASREELSKVPIPQLYEKPSERTAFLDSITQQGYVKEFPAQLRRKDGAVIAALITTVPVKNPDGSTRAFVGTIRDITERKRAEVVLKESERFLTNIVEQIPDMIFVKDAQDLRFVRFNKAGEDLLGYSRVELLGKNDCDLFPKDEADFFIGNDRNVLLTNQLSDVPEEKIHTRYKGERILHTKKIPIIDENGVPRYLLGISEDITERKRAEEKIHRSIEQFRTVMDSIDAFVYVVDMQTFEILFINKYGRDIWGEIEGKVCWQSIQYGQKGPCPFCTNDRLVDDNGKPTGIYNWEFQNTVNGHWYDCRDVAIHWLDGRVVRLEIATDITKSKQIENALRESEQRFRDLFENSRDGIVITEIDTRKFIDSNQTFSRMLGYNSEEIKNLGVRDIHPEDSLPYVSEVFEKMVRLEINIAENLLVKRKDGTLFYADISVYPLNTSNKGYLVGVFRDITDRKRAEEALRERETLLNDVGEMALVGGWELDVRTKVMGWTKETTKIYDISEDENFDLLKAILFFDLPDRSILEAALQRCMKNGEPFDLELPFTSAKGRHLWTRGIGRAVSVDGNVVKLAGTFQDITESKKAKIELKRSIEQFTTVMGSIDALVYVVDMHTYEILFINKYGKDIWGEIEGKVCWQTIQTGLSGPCPFCTNDRLIDKDGKPTGVYRWEFQNTITGRWYDCRDSAIRWYDGRFVRLEIATDVTERKRTEIALKESEERYRTLAEASPDPIFIVGRDDTMKFVNTASLKMFHRSYDQVIGTPRSTLFPPDIVDAQGVLLKKVFETGESVKTEEKIQFGTQEVWIDMDLVPLKDYTGNVISILGVARDITERKKAEVLLKRFNEELEQQVTSRTAELNASLEEKSILLREKEVLLREIHHRVRNILQMALSTMKQERRREPDERIQAALIRTENRVAAISFVFDRVYLSENLTRVKFGDIIRSLMSRLSGIYSIDQQRIHITVHAQDLELGIDLAIPLTLIANELISNAIQHAFPEDRSGEITISACEKENQIILMVKDTGAGMPAGIVPDLAVSTGFTQIRLLAEQTGGTLSQTSSRNGTTFSVAIPRSVELDKSGVKEV